MIMLRNLLLTGFLSVATLVGYSQCTEWVDPTPELGWTNFGSAPCSGEFNEIDGFEIAAAEAYEINGILEGGNYTFSACDGPSAGSWEIDYTIIAPSGAVDAYGLDGGSTCAITWTASESGAYLVVINEAGNCGVAGPGDNGYPKFMTNYGGADCPEPPVYIDGAESFEEGELPDCWEIVDVDGDGYNWQIINLGSEHVFHGEYAIGSFSYINPNPNEGITGGPIFPDDYLITPNLLIGAGDSLYFTVKGQDATYYSETYSVLVSTTGKDIVDFTDVLMTETIDVGGQWMGVKLDFSDYEGQNVYIAFRHHDSTDEFLMLLDAISLPGETLDCSLIDSVENLEVVEAKTFPNPANTEINITSDLRGNAVITVYDATGRVVMKTNATLSNATYTQNVEKLESGSYIIQIQTDNQVATKRFIKL